MASGKQIVRDAYPNDKLEFKIFGALQVITKKRILCGSLHVSGKLPGYPSPKQTLTLTSHLGQNVDLGKEWVGRFQETCKDPT